LFIIVVLHGITAEIIFWRCAMANHWVEDVIRLTRYLLYNSWPFTVAVVGEAASSRERWLGRRKAFAAAAIVAAAAC